VIDVGDYALNPSNFIFMITFNVCNEYIFYLLIKLF
jgi:hypothetical protein